MCVMFIISDILYNTEHYNTEHNNIIITHTHNTINTHTHTIQYTTKIQTK